MLGSGTIQVDGTISNVTVDIEISEMPQYFVAKAFVLDSDSRQPLCPAFSTDYYTQAITELRAMTVEDFTEDRVLNLDEDVQTNFAVYSDGVAILDKGEDVNVVTDNGDGTYVIANADETVTGLSVGDVFSQQDEDGMVLIVKIKEITVDSTTVTITEDTDIAMTDAFAYVKIESDGSDMTMEVDTGTAMEGITYEGDGSSVAAYSARTNIDTESSSKLAFGVNVQVKSNGTTVKIGGSLQLQLARSMKIYLVDTYQYVSLMFDVKATAGVSASGKLDALDVPLGKVSFFAYGVIIEIGPSLVLEFSSELSVEIIAKTSFGYVHDSDVGTTEIINTPMEVSTETKLEGTVFFGLQFEMSATISEKKAKLGDFYYSLDYGEFDWTTCPHISYKVEITAEDVDGNPIPDTLITGTGLSEDPVTNENGKAAFYVANGKYDLVLIANALLKEKTITIKDNAKSFTMVLEDEPVASGTCGNEVEWLLTGLDLMVISGSGDMADYAYTSEGVPWLKYRNNIKEVRIANGVTSIGSGAFALCTNLERISDLPGSVTHIGEEAFINCEKLKGNLEIPGTVATIGNYAFEGCTGLNGYLILNDGLVSIGEYAFRDCEGFIGDIVIPDSVTAIGMGAFEDCSGFYGDLTLPDGLTAIPDYAFSGCKSLGGILVLPDNLETIGNGAFLYCESLLGPLVIPAGVTGIGSHAFGSCKGLTEVVLQGDLQEIGNGAFAYCTGLTGELIIPENVTVIGSEAFKGCTGLNGNLVVPDSVTAVGSGAFKGCTGLNGTMQLSDSVTAIAEETFLGCTGLMALELPDGLVSIGENAFSGCSGLTTLNLPDSLTEIGAEAFMECTGLAGELKLPSRLTSVNTSVFQNCSGLTGTLTIPENVTEIGAYAFAGCSGLTGNLVIPDNVITLSAYAFKDCSGLDGTLTLSDQMTEIPYGAFMNCSGLKGNVVLSDKIQSVGGAAFKGCSGLTGVQLPDGITAIGSQTFMNCTGFEGALSIPDSVTTIGQGAYAGCTGLTGVLVIPDNVTEISGSLYREGAFEGCTGFTGLSLPDGLAYIGESAFSDCTGLSGQLVLPENLVSIGNYAFKNCVGFGGSLDLPDNMTGTIGDGAFAGCTGLTGSIQIPNGVTEIGEYAFSDCDGLYGSLRVGTGVTWIGTSIFGYQPGPAEEHGITQILFCGDAPSFSSSAFQGYIFTAYYPSGNSTWTSSKLLNYGGQITWTEWSPDPNISTTSLLDEEIESETVDTEVLSPDSEERVEEASSEGPESETAAETEASAETETTVEVSAPATETEIVVESMTYNQLQQSASADSVEASADGVQTALFTGLISGQTYVLLVMKDAGAEALLAADNLLYVNQMTADESGSISCSYIPRETCDSAVAMVYGSLGGELTDEAVTVTLPIESCTYDGTAKMPVPTVIYGESILEQEKDYLVTYENNIEIGTASVLITGINDYTGSVTVTFEIEEAQNFVIDDQGVLTEYVGELADVVIPDTVTAIGERAFYGCEILESVTVPSSVISIGEYAFADCCNLTDIRFSEGVLYIDEGVFSWCSGLTELELPEGLTEIGDYAFAGCFEMKTVILPSSLNRIGVYAFNSCSSLTELELSAGLNVIEAGAFSNCMGLTTVTIPENVSEIGQSAFIYCYGLEEILVAEDNMYYCSVDGCLYSKDGTALICVPAAKSGEFIVPDGVTVIGGGAFSMCSALTEIILPDSLTAVGDYAFEGCTGLDTMVFGARVSEIGEGALTYCEQMTSVTVWNPEAILGEYCIPWSDEIILYGYKGSTLEAYAAENEMIFKPLNGGDLADSTVTLGTTSYTYDGTAKQPSVTVVLDGTTLVEGTDYTVSYVGNDTVGTASVVVTGTGSYTGSQTVTFTIGLEMTKVSALTNTTAGIHIKWTAAAGASGYYVYRKTGTGSYGLIKTITDGDTITYTDTTAKSGTTYIYAVRAYSGSIKSSFEAESIKYLEKVTVSALTNTTTGFYMKWNAVAGASGYYVYRKTGTGSYSLIKTITSGTTVTYTDTTAKSGTTYTYAVRAYSGSTKGSFVAKSGKYLSKGTIASLTNAAGGIVVKWSKVTGASGYYVYRKAGSGSYSRIATITSGSTVSYADTAVKNNNGIVYTYAVRPYSGSAVGSFTGKSTVRLTTTAISSVKNSASGKMTVSWPKNSKATGYQIQYSTSSTFASGNKTVTVSGASTVSRVISGLTKGKTYYVRLRSYKTVGGINYYSGWSATKTIKITK